MGYDLMISLDGEQNMSHYYGNTSNSVFNSSSDSSTDDDNDLEELAELRMLMEAQRSSIERIPCRTSMLSGRDYILEVLVGNPTVCYEAFRMRPHVFMNLCDRLRGMELLSSTREVSVEEGLAMGLFILCHRVPQRIVAARFQHSTGTVHTWFKTVIRALAALATHLIRYVNRGPVQPEILANSRWYPYFEKCIGAIDGTHVAAWSPASKQKTFRGRSRRITQNVMAACSHDMMFTFIYTGWEGTANDSRVFIDALTRPENQFPMPPAEYYYVVDAGYPNIPGFLAPYRGERYHRSDFHGRGRITRKYELFNYRHSSLRNVIERAFGVLKARFPILQSIPNYPLRRQKLIPLVCCALHNFIRMEDRADRLFTDYGEEGLSNLGEDDVNAVQEGIQVNMSQQQQINAVREDIADHLWAHHNSR